MSALPLPLSNTGDLADLPDRALMSGVRGGDERAFEEIFRRHYAGVYATVLRIVGQPEEAEELAHDAFLKLYRRPLLDVEEPNVRAWLYRVATNAAFNVVRSRRRRLGWLARLAGRAESRGLAEDDPAGEVVARDEAARVREALARLPERQRMVLALRSAGLSYVEIAGAIGVRPGSVGTLLARAERAFRVSAGYEFEIDGGSDG